jgi:hypothetical protein
MSKKLSRELIAQKVKSDRIESIRNLNLWGSNIEDISILEEMPSLEVVSLSVNKIRTLKPFANLSNLRELYLRRNLISNLNEIKYLTDCQNLSVLWLSENPICDNPNYRAVVICVLPQLQKLDDIAITDAEREKAEKKIGGNMADDDEGEQEESNNRENGHNYYENNQNRRNMNENRNKYDDRDDDKDEYMKNKKSYEPNRNRQNDDYGRYNDRNNDKSYNNYDDRPIKGNNDKRYNNYDERPIKGNNDYYGNNNRKKNNYGDNNLFRDNYEENDNTEKKRGNSNVLNCVISLLKELSPIELKMVKKEIDRMNY